MEVPKLYLEEICFRSCAMTKKVNISWVIHPHTAFIQGLTPQYGHPDAGGVASRARGGAGAAGAGAGAGAQGGGAAASEEDGISSSTRTTTIRVNLCVGEGGCRQPLVLLVCFRLEQAPCLHTYFDGRAHIMGSQRGRLVLDQQALVRSSSK